VFFAPSTSSRLRRTTDDVGAPGDGRAAVVAHLDRWRTGEDGVFVRGALVVLDVEPDDALPACGPVARRRLGRTVERAVCSRVVPGDVVGRLDEGRFVVLRRLLRLDQGAGEIAAALAGTVEHALVGRPEGHGVRITAGGAVLGGGSIPSGRDALSAVTTAMLRGKLLTDERVAVVVASLDQPVAR
jgi:hypothetical protein